jgi:hypothetical protein
VAFVPGISLTLPLSSGILVACGLTSGAFAWQRTRVRQFPIDELTSAGSRIHCSLQCPAERRLAEQASALAHRSYGNIEGIPAERYESFLVKNPNILACLENSEGMLVGYFDVIPLRNDFMDAFVRGSLTELDIRHEHVLAPQHARRCKRLYLAGIALRDPHTFAARRHLRHLLWGLAKYLEHFYEAPSARQVFTLGGTPEGRHLLHRFNFNLVQEASARRDSQSLYVASLSDPQTIRDIDADIGNWAQACQLSWELKVQERTRMSIT